jgi:hypothetical protein
VKTHPGLGDEDSSWPRRWGLILAWGGEDSSWPGGCWLILTWGGVEDSSWPKEMRTLPEGMWPRAPVCIVSWKQQREKKSGLQYTVLYVAPTVAGRDLSLLASHLTSIGGSSQAWTCWQLHTTRRLNPFRNRYIYCYAQLSIASLFTVP